MDTSSARERARGLGGRQAGRISRAQLHHLGVTDDQVRRWVEGAYLVPKLPKVFAIGHDAPDRDGDLWEAILYAGPGAMLSHQTAAWWWGLTDREPKAIQVSTPRRCRSQPGIKVHGRRELDRVWHNGLTVTTVPQTLLDYSAKMPFDEVRYVLAEADYHRVLDLDAVRAIAGRGKPGSRRLLRALDLHWPDLARTDSPLEREFLLLIEAGGLPRPQVNVRVCGFKVDAYWPEHKVAVELDGGQGHGTERQVTRDHGRDLTLRSAGIIVRRYARRQVRWEGARVLADLRSIM